MADEKENQTQLQRKALQLDQQQVSYIVAGLLMMAFFIFIAGFYWGKKNAIEPLADQLASDSLADKIYYAFCSNCENFADKDDAEADRSEIDQPADSRSDENAIEQRTINSISNTTMIAQANSSQASANIGKPKNIQPQTAGVVVNSVVGRSKEINTEMNGLVINAGMPNLHESAPAEPGDAVDTAQQKEFYYAQLAGFGSKKAAQSCVDKLAQKKFEAKVVERVSKSNKGKIRKWYQVVSYPFESREKLLNSINSVKSLKLQSSVIALNTRERQQLFGNKKFGTA